MRRPLFIDDGYTETTEINPASDEGFEPFEAKYRPCVGPERSAWLDQMDGQPLRKLRELDSEVLADHVIEIDGRTDLSVELFNQMDDEAASALRNRIMSLGKSRIDSEVNDSKN